MRYPSPGDRCPCCLRIFEEPFWRFVVLDHDHATGRGRDFICQSCNCLIGRLEGGRRILKQNIGYLFRYLERHGSAAASRKERMMLRRIKNALKVLGGVSDAHWTSEQIDALNYEMASGIICEIGEVLESFDCGHSMAATPPMMYPEAICCALNEAHKRGQEGKPLRPANGGGV